MVQQLRWNVFNAIIKQDMNFFDENLTGELTNRSFIIGKRLAFNDGLFSGVLGILVAAGTSAVLWYGAKLIHDRTLSKGVLLSFLLYMLQVTLAFASLAGLYTELMQAIGASTRIFALMDQKPTIPSTADVNCWIEPRDFVGHVRFDHVYFTYPSRPEEEVLTDISFSIESGQKVALVGPSGSGKNTIASLIERFYDPKSGRIYFGSDLLSSINPQWLRQNLSFVNQEPSLFSCSIRDNVTSGFNRDEISLDQIIEVSKQANAHEFIEQLENQYDTLVGKRGICLSGGQKQRLAIARALLMNPKLLILDEATNALDSQNEYLINQTIEQSTHDSLMNAEDGIYKNLVFRQLMPMASHSDRNIF